MDLVGQVVTIVAVLVGALTTHMANHLMERQRTRYAMLTRWDERKLDAYATYIDHVRKCIYKAVLLYEVRNGMRSMDRSEAELTLDLVEAEGNRGRAFERVMMLAENNVIEAAHAVNRAAAAVDWQARGATEGTLQDWRDLHKTVFQGINGFHEAARDDLGVNGSFHGDEHSSRDLILPRSSRENGA